MVVGISLTNTIREALFQAAKKITRDKDGRTNLVGDGFEGQVETKYRHVSFASVSGIEFMAQIDTSERSAKISFVIPEEELEIEEESSEFMWLPGIQPREAAKATQSAWLN